MKKFNSLLLLVLFSLVIVQGVNAALGGSITSDGNYIIHTFYSSGTFNTTTSLTTEILIVAGGGGGGTSNGGNAGGGGAGGLIYNSSYLISTGNYNITIGGGGSGANGKNSSLNNTLIAVGGGLGGTYSGGLAQNGGSGGGAPQDNVGADVYGGNGTVNQGKNGGNSLTGSYGGSGGGGAGVAGNNSYGTNNREGGYGGNGLNFTINGSNVYYAGGGGGSSHSTATSGTSQGGLGGGGNGHYGAAAATNGNTNTGGGGGGGGESKATGSGGSGIVIIRYLNVTSSISINLTAPANNAIFTTTQNITFNYTVNSTSFPTLSCNLTDNNINLNSSINIANYSIVSYTHNNLGIGTHQVNVSCNGTTSTTNTYSILAYQLFNETYDNTTTELFNENFALNLTVFQAINNVTANLSYDGVNYNPTKTNGGYFNHTITIPLVTINNTQKTFYWNYTIYYTNGTNTTYGTTSKNQTISWKNDYQSTLNIKVYDTQGVANISSFTINATSTNESYIITTTNGTATLVSPMNIHQNKTFTISAYNMILNNISTTYNLTYNTNATITLYPTITLYIKLYDETTQQLFNISKPTSVQLQAFCQNSTFIIPVVSNNYTYNVSCYLTKLTTIVTYPTYSYLRTLPADLIKDYTNIKIWLFDATTTPYIVNTFQTYDLLGQYLNPRILISRIINVTEESITGDYAEVSNSITAYLVQNQQYTIKITSDNQPEKIMGTYTATTSGGITLNLVEFRLAGVPTGLDATTSFITELTNQTGTAQIHTEITSSSGSTSCVAIACGTETFNSCSASANSQYTFTLSANYSCTTQCVENINIVTPMGTYNTSKVLRGCNYVTVPTSFTNPNTMKVVLAIIIIIVALSLSVANQQIGGLLLFGVIALLFVFGPGWLLPASGVGLWSSRALLGLIGLLLGWNAFKN